MKDGSSAGDWPELGRELSRRFVVYLPSKTKHGEDIGGLDEITDDIANLLRGKFGGATCYPAVGYFGEQKEQVLAIESYCSDEDWQSSSRELYDVLRNLGRRIEQEAIACSLDGRMVLVKPGS